MYTTHLESPLACTRCRALPRLPMVVREVAASYRPLTATKGAEGIVRRESWQGGQPAIGHWRLQAEDMPAVPSGRLAEQQGPAASCAAAMSAPTLAQGSGARGGSAPLSASTRQGRMRRTPRLVQCLGPKVQHGAPSKRRAEKGSDGRIRANTSPPRSRAVGPNLQFRLSACRGVRPFACAPACLASRRVLSHD